VVWVMTTERW